MAKGVAVPVGVDSTGRLRTVSRDENASKTIYLALGDNDNDNAFQQRIGLGADHIFGIDSKNFRAGIVAQLYSIFAVFEREKLFSLQQQTVRWDKGEAGEQVLSFKYINMESDEVTTFARTFTSRK